VVPSIWPEYLGRTVLEAQYVGTPVIASNVRGIPELGGDIFLVEPGGREMLKAEILKVLSSEDRKSKINEAFTEESVCRQAKEIYNSVYGHASR